MSWSPIIEIDSGNKSGLEKEKEIDEAEFRRAVLVGIGSICQQLRLLNARFEDALETHIEEADV